MAVVPVTAPFEKLKKMRSLDEIRTRGFQALSAYREQKSGMGGLPSDEKFVALIDAAQFNGVPILSETLWQRFYKNGEERFFPVFKRPHRSAEFFLEHFGDKLVGEFIAAA
ncbi:MAG: hypothetical protein JO314_08860, partial [Acidobacteria bacterium]|nr:hypothetical protein [Acidobacteriota bacterium]